MPHQVSSTALSPRPSSVMKTLRRILFCDFLWFLKSRSRQGPTANHDVSSARIEYSPQILKAQFEFGLHYKHEKQYGKAIPLFQASRQDPRYKLESFINLGKCFLHGRELRLALFEFESALVEAQVTGTAEQVEMLRRYIERLRREINRKDSDPGADASARVLS